MRHNNSNILTHKIKPEQLDELQRIADCQSVKRSRIIQEGIDFVISKYRGKSELIEKIRRGQA